MQGNMGANGRIKVCYIITKGVWGGAQKYVYSLATSLPKNKYNVSVITGAGGTLKNKLEKNGIKAYEIKNLKRDMSLLSEIKSFITIFKIIKRERPHVLHLNSPKASGLGALAGRMLGVSKIIQTVHGWSFNENRDATSKKIIWFFSWVTVLLCHKTIVIAENEELEALRMPWVSKNKVSLIKNGVEQIKFKEKEVARVDLLLHSGKIDVGDVLWLGTIAELHKNKGLKYAIEAVSKIKIPFVYFIIGEGEERKSLEKFIKDKKLENRVFLPGFMDEANLNLKAFDIFLLPSIKEGLPYTILEAGLASLPVIATSVGGVPDIIQNDVTGILIKKESAIDIDSALKYLISNPDRQKLIGEKLREKVERDFSFDSMVRNTAELYQKN